MNTSCSTFNLHSSTKCMMGRTRKHLLIYGRTVLDSPESKEIWSLKVYQNYKTIYAPNCTIMSFIPQLWNYTFPYLCIIRKWITHYKRKTRQIWGIWKLRPAYSVETPNLGQNRWCFVPCDLEIWWMTLENNMAPLLCCFKLCATFHSHRWIQTGVAARKHPIWVKFDDF